MKKGPLVPIREAARMGGISIPSVYNYEKNGYLKFVDIEGITLVYYRDVLRASWEAKQETIRAGKTTWSKENKKDKSK